MTKVVIRYFDYNHFKRTGQSYEAGVFEDSYEVSHPYTEKPIPDELKAPEKVAFFNPQTQEWEDRSSDAEIAAAKKQQDDLAAAKQDAADAKATVTAQAATIASLTKQLTEATDAIVELAQATLPSSDAETTTKQEVAQ